MYLILYVFQYRYLLVRGVILIRERTFRPRAFCIRVVSAVVGRTLILRVRPVIFVGAQQSWAEDSRMDVFRAINRRRQWRQARKFPSDPRSFVCVFVWYGLRVSERDVLMYIRVLYITAVHHVLACLCFATRKTFYPPKVFSPIFHFKTRLASSKLTHVPGPKSHTVAAEQ